MDTCHHVAQHQSQRDIIAVDTLSGYVCRRGSHGSQHINDRTLTVSSTRLILVRYSIVGKMNNLLTGTAPMSCYGIADGVNLIDEVHILHL